MDPNQRFVNNFVMTSHDVLTKTMNSFEKLYSKINEMESYDDALKHKYLKTALQQVTDIRNNFTLELQGFRQKQKEERDTFKSKMKLVETDMEYTKGNVEYIKKVMQTAKFQNGASLMIMPTAVMAGASTVNTGPTLFDDQRNNNNISTFMT